MDESPECYAELKKKKKGNPKRLKDYILCDSIYVTFFRWQTEIGGHQGMENRLVVIRGWESGW